MALREPAKGLLQKLESLNKMLCKLWDAAANDTVGGREQHKGPKGVTQAMMARYEGMGKRDRKSNLAALK